jgi:hypothetical protein
VPRWCGRAGSTATACGASCDRAGDSDRSRRGTGCAGGSVGAVRYLGPEWMAAARRAVAVVDRLGDAAAGIRLTIEHVATDVPTWPWTRGAAGPLDGTIRWHVTIEGGRVQLAEGPAPQPDLRFTADYATAAAIARGELSAQRAFAEGRLRVGGDLSLLVRHQRALATVDDAMAWVRAETTYI